MNLKNKHLYALFGTMVYGRYGSSLSIHTKNVLPKLPIYSEIKAKIDFFVLLAKKVLNIEILPFFAYKK